jgi:hypothetical protein
MVYVQRDIQGRDAGGSVDNQGRPGRSRTNRPDYSNVQATSRVGGPIRTNLTGSTSRPGVGGSPAGRAATPAEASVWSQGYGQLADAYRQFGYTGNFGLGAVQQRPAPMMQAGDVRDRLMRMAQQQSVGGVGGGGGVGVGGGSIDPSTGSVLPGLPPELEAWYQSQFSNLRMQEQQAQAAERAQRNQAMMQAAEMRREAMRRAAGGSMDIGGALAESGIYSPSLVGIGQQVGSAEGAEGVAQARAARAAALENYLRNVTNILESGRGQRRDLEQWRNMQIAALTNAELQQLIGGSPMMGGL